MNNQVDIEKISDIELMTFVLEHNQQIQQLKQNLQLLNVEWEKRVKANKDKPHEIESI